MVRILSALVLIALVLATLWLLPAWATTIVAAAVAALAGVEVAHLAAKVGADVPAAFVGLASAVLTVAVAAPDWRAPGAGAEVSAAALLMLVVAAGAIALAWGPPSQSTFARAAVLSMAPTYVGLPLGAIAWVQGVSGPLATTWLLGTMALSDSAQFYTGRLLGRTRLAPAISPAKTIEGAVGGLVAAGVGGSILGPLCVPGLSPLAGAIARAGACDRRHGRRPVRVAAQAKRRRQGQLGVDSRPRRGARPDRQPSVCGARLLRVSGVLPMIMSNARRLAASSCRRSGPAAS